MADRIGHMLNVCRAPHWQMMDATVQLRWGLGLLRSGSVDVQTEDAARSVALLRDLVLHLGRVLADVQVPRNKQGAGAGQKVKDLGQGACSPRCQEPSHVSQEQATPQKRWAHASFHTVGTHQWRAATCCTSADLLTCLKVPTVHQHVCSSKYGWLW